MFVFLKHMEEDHFIKVRFIKKYENIIIFKFLFVNSITLKKKKLEMKSCIKNQMKQMKR